MLANIFNMSTGWNSIMGYIFSWQLLRQSYNQFTQEYSIVIAKYLVVANKSQLAYIYIYWSDTVIGIERRKKKKGQPNNLRNYFNFCIWTLNRIITIHLISTNEFYSIRSQSQMQEWAREENREKKNRKEMKKEKEEKEMIEREKKEKNDKNWIGTRKVECIFLYDTQFLITVTIFSGWWDIHKRL